MPSILARFKQWLQPGPLPTPPMSQTPPSHQPQAPMLSGSSPEIRKLVALLERRAPLIFLTGRAGTGKTYVVKELQRSFHGHVAVVAPTGIAARNVDGQTINSFFKAPFAPIDLTVEAGVDLVLFPGADVVDLPAQRWAVKANRKSQFGLRLPVPCQPCVE